MPTRKVYPRMTDSSDDTLGGRLSAARDASGLSLADVANRVGVKRDSLLAWEADRAEPRPSNLIDLAGILGVSPMWLMTGVGSGPIQEAGDLPLEALKLDLQRLTEAHLECGRLIEKIARQIETYEERHESRCDPGDLDGPVMGRA
ncbi:helix-turn-helix domain-containing protein [Agrobacterium sp. RAC06]|uniref:helix-turn-helix domain-containing protein n=1 Tax=Agrobacterium sp. RAC06 TaxID=1842536 RepID=UPI00083D473B|nr:helix-turn-helix transcriptional regulator [Agrobacterium sp. RAC06]AOG09907.1 helix-turn-helix family protein [Agrobacterium sp. RAC06]